MADSTIPLTKIRLLNPYASMLAVVAQPEGPLNSTAANNAAGHNVASDAKGIGSRIVGRNTGNGNGIAGPWGLVYGQMGVQSATTQVSTGSICAAYVGTSGATPATGWVFTNNSSGADINTGRAAVAISAMTDSRFGWFWDQGVCPDFLASSSTGTAVTCLTDSNVAKDSWLGLTAGTGSLHLVLKPITGMTVTVSGTATDTSMTGSATFQFPIGLAMAADS